MEYQEFYITLVLCCCLTAHAEIVYTLSENSPVDTIVGQVIMRSHLLTKYNSSLIKRLQYSLMSRGSLPTDYFSIDNQNSELRIAKPIDRDNLCDLLIICCEYQRPCRIPLSIVAQFTKGSFVVEMIPVKIEITDVNDNSPTFQSRSIQGHISEVAEIGSTVTLPTEGNPLIAIDRDGAPYSVKRYSIISPTGTFGLKVFEEFNVITDVSIVSKKALDREKVGSYTVVVMAHDGGKPSKSGSVTVEINIDDFNDHKPTFENETYSIWLSETAPKHTFVMRVQANDQDSGSNAAITYSIKNHPTDIVTRLFTINPSTGEIRTKEALNFEQRSSYRIHVEAKDKGIFIQKKARATVTVHLEDENDHGPIIQPGYLGDVERAEVIESAPLGTFVAFLIVTDPDDDNVNCIIDNSMFRLRRSTTNLNEFRLVTAHEMNRELSETYKVTLKCTDNGKPALQTAETVTIYIKDANDNPPIFTKSVYTASLVENNELDSFVLEVKAHDLDNGENARIIYALDHDGETMFHIDSTSGMIYTKRSFNREEEDVIYFKVIARDNGSIPLESEATVVVNILDENDNAPTFRGPSRFEISEAAGAGVMLGHISATDPDLGLNSDITFQLKPDADSRSFSIMHPGIIKTLVALDRETQSQYHLVVIARDRGLEVEHSSSTTVTISVTDINDNPPIISFPNAYNNTIYISYLEPVQNTLVYVNASDKDTGRNALLEYTFTHGNEWKFFQIEQTTGAIRLSKALTKQDAVVHKIGIRVTDRAEPFHATNEMLNIVVDGTGKPISIEGAYLTSMEINVNLIIVIGLAAVSLVLALILVVAIVRVRRAHRQHRLARRADQVTYEHRPNPVHYEEPESKLTIRREIYCPAEADTYTYSNGHQSPVYSSLRPQNHWKRSLHPESVEV